MPRSPKATAKAPPALANTGAKERIELAAQAAGLTPEELGSLMVDAGLTALPPSDGITDTYTLEDLGERLWAEAVARSKTSRGEWFHSLVPVQQKAVVTVLRHRGYASQVIAQEFNLDSFEVQKIYTEHADKLGQQVVGLRLNTIAGQMMLAKEQAQQWAANKKDARAFWSIEKDYIAKLQDLGIVDRAIHRVEHTHKFDQQAHAEIEAVLELERKKREQAEGLEQIKAVEFDEDPMPESELDE